jgi:16S rRNA (uracil1498-N3)-methyltransferase
MTHFYVEPDRIRDGSIVISGPLFRHIVQVRRCRKGDIIRVIDGTSREYAARIEECRDKSCTAVIEEVKERLCEPRVSLTLYQAMIKANRFEMILEKSAELGVSRIVPLVCERTIAGSADPGKEKMKRWQKILIGAAGQSGRAKIPELSPVMSLDESLRQRGEECLLVFSPRAEAFPLKKIIDRMRRSTSAGVLIGPEGGFTPEEIAQATSMGAMEVYLGPRILRAETAAIASAAIVLYELEHMGE